MKRFAMLAGSAVFVVGNVAAQTTGPETGPAMLDIGDTEALLRGGTRRSNGVRVTMIGAVLALLFSFSLALSPVAEAHIYWSTGSSIGRANLDGTGVDENFITGTCESFGLAVDSSYLYWTNAECHSIGRANADGTGADQNFITGLDLAGGHPAKPEGLAVDAAYLYFYMLNGAANIGRANIDGSDVEEQWRTIGLHPGGWGVEVDSAHIYFAGYSGIGRMNLDGSGYNGQFIDLGYPPLEVAVGGAHIYWTLGSSIGRANLDGSGVNQNFITGAGLSAGIAVGNGHIYWTNGYSIARANLDGTEVDLNFITGVFANASLALDPPHVPDYMILGCDPQGVNAGGSSKCVAHVLDQSGEGIPATGTVSFTTSGGTLGASTCTLNTHSYCGVDWYPPADGVAGDSYWIKAHYNGDSTFLPGDFPYPTWVQIGAAGASPPPAPGSSPTWRESVLHELLQRSPEAFTEVLIGDLEASGLQVSEGSAELYTLDDCIDRTYPALKNCFLANPAAPYVIPVVKLWPEEYVDPATVNAFVETEPGYSATYRLDPREAILMYGEMPPPGRYMGLQTWEFSEQGEWKPEDYNQWANTPDLPFPMQYLFQTMPPDDPMSRRLISLSALGDVVNNAAMERQSGYPFGQTRYFIITPSASTERAVRSALQAQGVPDGDIFTEQIPDRDDYGPIGPLGMGENAIDFITAFRYAVPNPGYEQAAADWRADPPLTVLRVRAPASLGPVQRYGSLIFEPLTASSEAYLGPDLDDLVTAMCGRLSSQGFTSADCTQPPPESSFMKDLGRDYGWAGPYCRDIGMNCQADQQEAAYPFSAPRYLDTGQVFAVAGTLATETGNATYVGLSANDLSMMAGVANALDTDLKDSEGSVVIKGLKGSADSYASTVKNTDKFFVYYFAWDCDVLAGVPGGENCARIPADLLPPDEGDLALRGTFTIGLRNYIAQETQRGPDPSKLLTPMIFTFMQL